jgi:hypothetical protein
VLNYTPWGPRGWGCRATGPAINVNSSELRSSVDITAPPSTSMRIFIVVISLGRF